MNKPNRMATLLVTLCFLFTLRVNSFLSLTNPRLSCKFHGRLPIINNIPCRQSPCRFDTRNTEKQFGVTKLHNSFSNEKDAGWDMFGRVPYDDWLFTTARLADPNLLKRSFVEAVNQEIPIALSNFQRKLSVEGMVSTALWWIPLAYILLQLSKLARKLAETAAVQRVREDAARGFRSAIGVYRKATGGGEEAKTSRRRPSMHGGDDDEPFQRILNMDD